MYKMVEHGLEILPPHLLPLPLQLIQSDPISNKGPLVQSGFPPGISVNERGSSTTRPFLAESPAAVQERPC